MNNGELQFIADTILIRRIDALDRGLAKSAGLESLMGGLTSGLDGLIGSETIDKNHPFETVANLLVPSVLFRINRPLGIIYALASRVFHFNIGMVIEKILSAIKPKLESGEPVTPEEVNRAGVEATSAQVGGLEDGGYATANVDMFQYLRKIDANQQLIRVARVGESSWESVFKELHQAKHQKKAGWLIGAIVTWLVKNVLMSVGLLAGAGAIAHFFSHDENKQPSQEPTNQSGVTENQPASYLVRSEPLPEPIPNSLNASGRGEQVHNNGNSVWYIPLRGMGIPNLLIRWAEDIYPELAGKDQIIRATTSFNKLVNILNGHVEEDNLVVPKNLHSRKEIVDLFAGEAATKIKGK